MATITNLQLLSKRQIKTNILVKILALLGLNDINDGSVLDVLSDAIAQEDFSQYVAMAQIARLVNLDYITGTDLDNKAFEYGLIRDPALPSTGLINILRPVGFVKVATTFYAGLPAPIAGNTVINVNNASSVLIGSSGTLILGRGTANEEQVTYSSAPINNINYWTFTVSPLANNHSVEESVILAQGINESILAGTQIQVPSTGTTAAILFTTDDDVVLLSGESEVDGVSVTAVTPGSAGNISTNQINGTQAFPTPPFSGAIAVNPEQFTTGEDQESDASLRDAIRNWVQSLSRGIKAAIKNAIIGLVDPVTAKRVVSANIVLPQSVGPVLVYIDDGNGFEPSFQSQGFEDIVDSAFGKETRLQLNFTPIIKAQVASALSEPFNMSTAGLTLTYTVGNFSETVTFQNSDFTFPGAASAGEIVAAINNRAKLIEARTANGGTGIVITGVTDSNEQIQVTGGTSNSILGFSTTLKYTLLLYKNDLLLNKDGFTATLDSQNLAPFDFTAIGASPWFLDIVVDGKTANPQVVTFQTSDFVTPSAGRVAEVIAVINAQLSGATAIGLNNNTQVRIISNTPLSSASQLHVTGGTANNATFGFNFSTTPIIGANSDYTLNRELGTIQLNTPLALNDTLTAGSIYTRAELTSLAPELYSPSNGQTLVIVVDGGSPQTITFDASFVGGKTAAFTAAFINEQLAGATAIARQIGNMNYLQIHTDTYNQGIGSIEITSASTGNSGFGFEVDTTVQNQRPDRAFQVSGNFEPYRFAQNDDLIVVLDNDIVNNTFSIQMTFASITSAASSTTVWSSTALANIFPEAGTLVNFYTAFTSGANTTTGSITDAVFISGNTWQYDFASLPSNLASYAIGDLIHITGMSEPGNNGYFVITGISTSGNGYIQVTNLSGVVGSGETGTGLLSQCRRITSYSGTGGTITVGSAFSNTPSISDPFIVIPSTVTNLVAYLNNTKITSFNLQGFVEGSNDNGKLQLSSQSQGSDGYIQVTGGQANLQLEFPTNLVQGLAAYDYYTGLLQLVHKTIYGDDTDLDTYPGVGAAGITFYELPPTVQEVEVSVLTTLAEGITISSLQNSISSAISGYINNLGVGDEVVIEEIRAAVIAIAGIIDVQLIFPLANIPIANNQLARTNSSLIAIS